MAHVVFIHGIGNKPPLDRLLASWERSLARDDGLDLGAEGVTTSMVYWADVLYPEVAEDEGFESLDEVDVLSDDVDLGWRGDLAGDESAFVESLAGDLGVDREVPDEAPPLAGIGAEFERVPLPGPIKRIGMKLLLRDVHHYLFNALHRPRPEEDYAVQEEIRQRTVAALEEATEYSPPRIVVSHSMGTVIAYDCLKRVHGFPKVDGWITLGSPLGRGEIPYQMRPEWTKDDGFPFETLTGDWVNVYDRFDPVSGLLPKVARMYRHGGEPMAVDLNEQSWGAWRHDVSKYLAGAELRKRVAAMLEL